MVTLDLIVEYDPLEDVYNGHVTYANNLIQEYAATQEDLEFTMKMLLQEYHRLNPIGINFNIIRK